MAGAEPERVTPSGVRDGDPAALAALCAARGPAVLAYTGSVLAGDVAVRAAAEAFARFRAAVIALGDAPGVDPDRLLLGATRRATAALAPPPPPARLTSRRACEQLPQLLAARLEGELSTADEARVTRHLLRCSHCRALAGSLDAGELAFATPPPGPVPADAVPAIVGALATAGGPLAPTPEQITAEFAALPPLEPEAVAPAVEPPAAAADPEPPAPAAVPPPADDAITSLMPPVGRAGPAGPPPMDPPAAPVATAAPPPAFARLPRHRPHLRDGDVLRTVVLPLAVVGVAAILAMAIAGVFGEDEPAPLSGAPVITAPAETIPGAGGGRPEPTTVRPGEGPPPGVPRSPEEAFGGGLGVPGPGVVADGG